MKSFLLQHRTKLIGLLMAALIALVIFVVLTTNIHGLSKTEPASGEFTFSFAVDGQNVTVDKGIEDIFNFNFYFISILFQRFFNRNISFFSILFCSILFKYLKNQRFWPKFKFLDLSDYPQKNWRFYWIKIHHLHSTKRLSKH